MKFSELWLREWISTSLDTREFLNQITMSGLEVNAVEAVSGPCHGVVIGQVLKCEQHRNNNNLLVTKINIGKGDLLNIVCANMNCWEGMKVAVAPVGAVLQKKSQINALRFFGELSEGILCSYSELGIAHDHSGIIELPEDAPIGSNIRDYLKLNDNIIQVSITPNRADCLGMIGIARNVTLLSQDKLNLPDISPVDPTIHDTLPIHIEAKEACPRYLGRVVKGINVKRPTPIWMKEKLRRSGILSINSVNDITNYVLLELGQPIHTLDRERIDGGIIVRMAKEGEMLVLRNGNVAMLKADTLVISDYHKALEIAGIFGGKDASITNETKDILLECAFFSPLFIAERAQRYGINSETAHRYECGVDPAIQKQAMDRVTRLLIDICGGEAGPIIDVTNEITLPKRSSVSLRRTKLDRLLGHHIDDNQVKDILYRIGCEIKDGQDFWEIIVPSWRFDIKIEEDLVEEVARVYGYQNIPNDPVVQAGFLKKSQKENELSLKRVKMLLNDKGYQEVITYSFVDPKVQQLIHPGEAALILPAPISNEMSVMRLSLLSGLLKTIVYNQNRQQTRIRIFETGLRFVPDTQANLGIREDMMVAGAICGNFYEEHWDLQKKQVDFYDVKGDIESVLDLTGKISEITFRTEAIPALHPGHSAGIYLKDKRIGLIGVLHPEVEGKLNLNSSTIVFELEWKKVSECLVPQFQNISRFPSNRRDIAIVVPENVPASDILSECKKVSVNRIAGVNLFDVYFGQEIPKGFKSLAITLILQATDRTLSEEEISAIVSKCVEVLQERFHASLRN